MKIKLRRFVFACFYYVGIIHLFYWLNRKKQRILVFHHIIPDKYLNDSFEQDIVCTSCSKFERLMSLVNKRLQITIQLGLPASAVITFDDGYRAALVADKVLERRDNKAYFFMPLANVGGGPLWIDQVMAWFAYVPEGCYRLNSKNVFSINDRVSRQRAFSSLVDGLYGMYDKESLLKSLDLLYPFQALPIEKDYFNLRFRGLSEGELHILKQKGHKIGGHSVAHDILSQFNVQQLQNDFGECSQQIGHLLNTDLYAYPFGHKRDVNAAVIQACSESLFQYAVLNEYNSNPSDFSLSRLNISHYDSRYEVEAALSGLTQAIKNNCKWIYRIK